MQKIRRHTLAGGLVTALFFTTSLYAEEHHEEEHHEHEAHEHGAANLEVARQANSLEIIFHSAAMNIVGFEHAANSEQELNALQEAKKTLLDANSLFPLPEKADCQLKKAEVESPLLSSKEEIDHPNFEAHYHFECRHPGKLTDLTTEFMSAFPSIHELRIQMVTETGQSSIELKEGSKAFRLP